VKSVALVKSMGKLWQTTCAFLSPVTAALPLCLLAVVAVLSVPGTASAGFGHYFTQGDRLYISDGGAAPSVVNLRNASNVALNVSSLSFSSNGDLWGFVRDQTANRGFYTFNAFTGLGTKQFDIAGTNVEVNSFDFRGNEIMAFVNKSPSGSQDFYQRFDSVTGSALNPPVNTSSSNPGYVASGYDANTDTLYAINGRNFDLEEFDPTTGEKFNTVGDLGKTWSGAGGAWFNNQLYFAYRVGTEGVSTNQGLVFGKVDLTTGAFTQDFAFTELQTPIGPGFGYAVGPGTGEGEITAVPEPTSLGIAGIAFGAFAIRRWKRKRKLAAQV
jgi:hypothetical protein